MLYYTNNRSNLSKYSNKILHFNQISERLGIAGGLKNVNRSKRLKPMGHLTGGWHLPEQVQLIDSSIFSFLCFDVVAYGLFVPAYCGNTIASGPKMLTCKVLLAAKILPCDMDSAFTLDETNHLRNRIFGWNGYQHMRMISHKMTFQNLALSPSCQFSEHFTQISSKINVKLFLAILWNPC